MTQIKATQIPLDATGTQVLRTPLDDAQDAFENAFDAMDKAFTFWLDLSRARANPELDENEHLLDVTSELQGKIVEAAYEVVRTHQRMEQIDQNRDFPFNSLDEGYFCPTCGYVDEDTIANSEPREEAN